MELDSEHLWDDVQVWYESRLENDGDVWSVEQFDGVAVVLTPVTNGFDWNFHAESLKKIKSTLNLCQHFVTRVQQQNLGNQTKANLEVDDDSKDERKLANIFIKLGKFCL